MLTRWMAAAATMVRQKIAEALRVPGTLEGDDGHGRSHHVEDQLAQTQRYPVIHQLDPAQHVAHQHENEQIDHLLAHRQEGIQQVSHLLSAFSTGKVYTGKGGLSRHNGCFGGKNGL